MCITHKGAIVLETERLLLRPFQKGDAEYVYKYASDHETTQYMRFQTHKSIKDSEDIVNFWVNGNADPHCYNWCIVCKECSQPVGSIAINEIVEFHSQGSIGYILRKDHWNKGLMSEACKRLVRFCFEELNFQRVECLHSQENPASGRVMVKSGMQFEGTKKEYFPTDHGYIDCNMYAITRSRFESLFPYSSVCKQTLHSWAYPKAISALS